MTNQEAINIVVGAINRMHKDSGEIRRALDAVGDAPFEDPACNADFRRYRREWTRQDEGLKDWHEGIFHCAKKGDPEAEFGGK